MSSRQLLIGFISFCIFATCKKKEEPKEAAHPISISIFPLLFEKGSYWVYKDSVTSMLDSMFIANTLMKEQFYGDSRAHVIVQQYEMEFNHFFDLYQKNLKAIDYKLQWDYGTGWGDMLFFKYPKADSITYAHFRPGGIADTLQVQGKKYSNVYIGEIDKEYDKMTGTFKRYYFKDSIGIIRYESFLNYDRITQKELLHYTVKLHPM